MRNIIIQVISIILIFITNNIAAQNINDNIKTVLKNYPVIEFTKGPIISKFKEGNNLYIYKTNTDQIAALSIDDTFYGFLLTKGNKSYFVYDTNGDSILDYKSDLDILPYWLVSPNNIKISQNSNFTKSLDILYRALKSNEGMKNKIVSGYNSIIINNFTKDYPDRNLIYELYLYHDLVNNGEFEMANNIIDNIIKIFNEQHVDVPIIIKQYKSESLLQLNKISEALVYIDSVLKLDGEFIPALINKWSYDKSLSRDDKIKITNIFNKNMNHWSIIELRNGQ
jgi:hypothetical protein